MLIKLTMKNISLIVTQLKDRQIQIDRKINQQLILNLDPFPIDRLDKGNKLLALIGKTLQAIEADNLIQAGMHLKELELEGLKLEL